MFRHIIDWYATLTIDTYTKNTNNNIIIKVEMIPWICVYIKQKKDKKSSLRLGYIYNGPWVV